MCGFLRWIGLLDSVVQQNYTQVTSRCRLQSDSIYLDQGNYLQEWPSLSKIVDAEVNRLSRSQRAGFLALYAALSAFNLGPLNLQAAALPTTQVKPLKPAS